MSSIPNTLSLARIPLAFLFLQSNPLIRITAIILALVTDGLDGYLARRNQWTTNLGKVLDPLTDKFFVFFTLAILLSEEKIEMWQIMTMLSRDWAIAIYGIYLLLAGKMSRQRLGAIWCGKITTVLQLIVLMSLTLSYQVPNYFFQAFIVLGVLALFELYLKKHLK